MRRPASTWTLKPPCGVQTNYGSAFAAGLVNHLPMDENTELMTRDLMTHLPLSRTVQSTGCRTGPLGMLRYYPDNSTNTDYVANQVFCRDGEPFTMLFWWQVVTNPGTQRSLIDLEGAAAGGVPRLSMFVDRTGGGSIHYYINNTNYFASNFSYTAGQLNQTVITFDPGNLWQTYFNGRFDTSIALNNNSGTPTNFFIDSGFSNSTAAGFMGAATWRRQLTPAEVRALYDDPFALSQPPGPALLRLLKTPPPPVTRSWLLTRTP